MIAFQQGIEKEASVERIFHRYWPRCRRFFAGQGFGPDECADLAQEAFMRIFRNLESFRGDSTFASWVFGVCANIAKNELRSRATLRRDGGQELPLDKVNSEDESRSLRDMSKSEPLEQVLRDERSKVLIKAVQALPPGMRRCMELRLFQDLRYQEIAAITGIGLSSVRSTLFEARKRLKPVLEAYFGPDPFADDATTPKQTSGPVISHNVSAGLEPQERVPGLAELIQAFLEAEHSESPHTSAAYQRHLQGFLSFLSGSPITVTALTGYCAHLWSDGRSKASHRQALAAVRGFLRWLFDTHGKAVSLPSLPDVQRILRVPDSKEEQSSSSIVTDEEAQALLKKAPTARDCAMLGLFLGGGLKVNELVRLRIEDFKHRGSTLSVTVKGRTVPLPSEIGELVARYLEETGRTWQASGLLLLHLPCRGGRPSLSGMLSNRAVEYRLRQLVSIAGLTDRTITSHSLRQTFAARFLRDAGDITVLKERLGHASIATTGRYLQ